MISPLPLPPTPLIGRERELAELGELLVKRTHRSARLAVFRAGITTAAAEQVAEADPDTLAALVDKSLSWRQTLDRFDLHELLRQFAAQKLAAFGEEPRTQERHLAYFLSLAEEAAQHYRSSDQADWLTRIATEHDNLRASLTWVFVTEQPNVWGALGHCALAILVHSRLLRGGGARG